MWFQILRDRYRIGPFPIIDTLGSLVIVYLIAPWLSLLAHKLGFEVPRLSWVWLTVPIALLTHIIFRVNTPLTKMILDPAGGYWAKIAIIIIIFYFF